MSFEFISFPNEVLRTLGGRLESFSSALALSSTCRTLHDKSIIVLLGNKGNLGKYLAKAIEHERLRMLQRVWAMVEQMDVSRVVVPIQLSALSNRLSLVQVRFQSLQLQLHVDINSQKAFEEANWPSSLEKLTLRSQHITPLGLQRLISSCKQLKELDVQQSNLDDVALRYILQNCQSLQVVDFHGCRRVTLENLLETPIPTTIKHLKGLKHLVSSFMPIAVQIAASAVLPGVAPLAAIAYSRMSMNQNTDDVCERLNELAPDFVLE